MQRINALSLTSNVNDWLVNSRHPRILHVFDHACNLLSDRREVLSIVTPQIGNGPFNLVTQEDILFSDYLNAQFPISILTDQLRLGDLIINTTDANLWHPCPDWESLHKNKESILGKLASLRFADYRPLLPTSLVSSLSIALANADAPTAIPITRQLAGLGQGLTPAGDDFIIGAIYATWIIHPPEVVSVIAKEITNIAAPLTTSLSAAWLRSAGKGEAGILWHDFFNALVFGEPAQIEKMANNILAIGETSGADALAGFFGVCMSFNERIIDQCHS
jgi:hypothetical protein